MPTLTRVDYEAAEFFGQERLELVAGQLISKMGASRPHVNAFTLVLVWLQEVFGIEFINAHSAIDVDPGDNPINEPEPDIIVLKRDFTTFTSGNPQPQDLSLLVEIADSSLAFDLSVKAPLYARAFLVEYWVLDVTGRRLFCHRDPASGKYTNVVIYQEDGLPLLSRRTPCCVRGRSFHLPNKSRRKPTQSPTSLSLRNAERPQSPAC